MKIPQTLAICALMLLPLAGQAQLRGLIDQVKNEIQIPDASGDIGAGLREALDKGVDRQVSKLTAPDGFLKNELVRIALPDELQKVDRTLRKMGMGKLADDGIKSLNRAAEEAVKESTPIFAQAIKNISFKDAKGILMGNRDAATQYLKRETSAPLYDKFLPVVKSNIGKVGADKIWENLINKYNALPMVSRVNPNINDHVTQKALEGVFTMIAVEEKNIRTDLSARTSPLLKKIFAMQDKK